MMRPKIDSKKPNLLLLTGPQGSGNHKFSKIAALHPEVEGWEGLNREHWINHDGEPFKHIWKNPHLIDAIDWGQNAHWCISISSPYVDIVGTKKKTFYPDYKEIILNLRQHCNVQIGIIGRDQNILEMNQLRKRGVVSYHNFLNKIDDLTNFGPENIIFLSHELLYLYRHEYLWDWHCRSIIPIDYKNPKIHFILNEDHNRKYVHYVEESWLDKRVGSDGLLKDGSEPHDI